MIRVTADAIFEMPVDIDEERKSIKLIFFWLEFTDHN